MDGCHGETEKGYERGHAKAGYSGHVVQMRWWWSTRVLLVNWRTGMMEEHVDVTSMVAIAFEGRWQVGTVRLVNNRDGIWYTSTRASGAWKLVDLEYAISAAPGRGRG